jgi:hypothetical protein
VPELVAHSSHNLMARSYGVTPSAETVEIGTLTVQ